MPATTEVAASEEVEAGSAAKKQKVAEEPEKEKGPVEHESDAPLDKRPALTEPVAFAPAGTTLNVIPTLGGKILTSLAEGGMQYLIAGARANVGARAGRYLFEARVLESLSPADGAGSVGKAPTPQQLVRLGFSAAGSSLLLGDGSGGISFSEANGEVFGRGQVIGLLLNLDPESKNANTVSLFKDGARASEPIPLPANLKGQTLYPHVAFRNVTVQVHFGPTPLSSLPFVCRTFQGAAQADVEVAKTHVPRDGQYEVVFPVACPDEGTFDWLEDFLKENPHFVELSDRKILEWAQKSGMTRPKSSSLSNSNDKPDFKFGIQAMDSLNVRQVISSIAPLVPRNYVVMEVQKNLSAEDRKAALGKFWLPHFRKSAHVVLGDPDQKWIAKVHEGLLADKQRKEDLGWQTRKVEFERKKVVDARQKQLQEAKKKAEEEAFKKARAAGGKEGEKEQAGEADEKKDVSMDGPEASKEPEAENFDGEPPKVELHDAEKKRRFFAHGSKDLAPQVLSKYFTDFSIPEKGEGFHEIRFHWADESASREYLRKWIRDQKVVSRIEDLKPGSWFREAAASWRQVSVDWQKAHGLFKAMAAQKKASGEAEEEDVDVASARNSDIFSIQNVCDVGGGEPLFSSFGQEDWKLFELRYELCLLTQSFKKDAGDDERPGIHESHLLFYYIKYFCKQLFPRNYGKDLVVELVELVKDAVAVDASNQVLVCQLEEADMPDLLLKLTEQGRRERQRRIDAGDETARLKFSPLLYAPPQAAPAPAPPAAGVGAEGGTPDAAAVAAMAGAAGHFQGGVPLCRPAWQQAPRAPHNKGVPGGFGPGSGKGRQVCKQFQGGACSYGERCRFAHER